VKESLVKDTSRLPFIGALLLIGIFWSATIPLSKVAVSGGHAPLGITVWQQVVVAAVLGALLIARWAIFLGEDYSPYALASLALMLTGLMLVQPPLKSKSSSKFR